MPDYRVKAPVFLEGRMHKAGEVISYTGSPGEALHPLDEEAIEQSRRAQLRRELEAWLQQGQMLIRQI